MKKIKTVLLIDDDAPTNFIHKKIVEGTGLVERVYVAQGGQEALDLLENKRSQENGFSTPDLIFLDINMPAMDGWEFLAQYKHIKKQQDGMVVVMLTTSLNPDDEQKAKGIAEVYAYRNKPLTKRMIEEIAEQLF